MKIKGNTIGTTMPRSDWNQTNPNRADYIKNKPIVEGLKAIDNGNGIVTLVYPNGGGEAHGGGGSAVSPTVEVTEIDGGHKVTVTDVNGSQSFDVMDGKDGGLPYYRTIREVFENADTLKTADIYELYRGLGAVENTLGYDADGTPINEYVFSVGDYNTAGEWGILDADIKKPTFLVGSGIHGGIERTAMWSTYRFFADLVSGKNLPSYLKEGAIFKVVPVITPWSLDNKRKVNKNGVNINRNFDYNWVETEKTGNYSGPSAASEAETQAVVNWLSANKDAVLFIDMHNGACVNETVGLIGEKLNGAVTRLKKIGLRGLDKIVPFWRALPEYADGMVAPYSSNVDYTGTSTYYASEILDIPSLTLECSSIWDGKEIITPEKIAIGAESLGNILLEAYNQEVISVVPIISK